MMWDVEMMYEGILFLDGILIEWTRLTCYYLEMKSFLLVFGVLIIFHLLLYLLE